MPLPLLALAGAGLGGGLGYLKNKRAQQIEDSSRKLASETARYSPWTGMTPNAIQYNQGSMFGDIGSGLLAGGMSGASMAGGGGAAGAGAASGAGASPGAGAGMSGMGSGGSPWASMAPNMFQDNQQQQPNQYSGWWRR